MGVAFFIAPSSSYFTDKNVVQVEKSGSLFVIFDQGHCGYVSFNENGEPEGYVVSLISQIAERAGMNVNFEVLPSDTAELMVRNGFADILISDRFTQDYNSSDFLLTSPFILDAYVLVGKNKQSSIENVANSRIAIVDNQYDTLKYPLYSIFYDTMIYRNYDEALVDLADGEFDYLFGRYSTLNSVLEDINELKLNISFSLETCPWCMAFCSLKPELKKKIESICFQMSMDRTFYRIEAEYVKDLIDTQSYIGRQPVYYWSFSLFVLALIFILVMFVVFYFEKIKKENNAIFDILSEDFEAVFLVNTKSDKVKVLRMNPSYDEHFSKNEDEVNFYARFKDGILRNVYTDDKEYVSRAFNKNTILKELKKSSAYYISYRIVFENKIYNYQTKISRSTVGAFKNFIVAIRSINFDANVDKIRESQIPLINVLLYDYEDVAYSDLDTGNISHYRFSEVLGKNIPSWRNIMDFPTRIQLLADKLLDENDKIYFIEETKKESILQHLKENPVYSVDFRLILNGEPVFYQVKFILVSQNSNSIVLGFRNIDTEKRRELSQKRNLELIEVLSSEYESVFYINLEVDSFISYRVSENLYRVYMNLFKKIIPYSRTWAFFVQEFVYDSDQKAMLELGNSKLLMDELKVKKSVSEIYRSNVNGRLEYFNAKFVRVDEEDSSIVVLGLKNCDDEIRAEREKQNQLKNAMVAAESANKAKTTFLFNMSHDIRTPMNAILGFTAMAKRNLNDMEKVSDSLDKVEIAGNYLLELIDDILDMSRIENNKTTVELIPANIYQFSNDMIEIIKQRALEQNINFTTEFRAISDENIYADVLHTNQILLNILSNAVKYTKPGGDVHFLIEQIDSGFSDSARFRFVISDNGIGMSEEFVAHIFESFSREKNTTLSGIKGTGLGMAITKKLIDLLEGSIDVDSKLGKGTTVSVELTYQIIHETLEIEDENSSAINEINLAGKRVLLVEDNELNREIAQDVLETEKLIVDIAVDGIEAVEKVKHSIDNPYDFVLMDIQMPRMDGYTATKTIRGLENKITSSVPIIAMTANAFDEDKKKAFECGMNAHLAKPIDIQKLIFTLKNFSL